MRKYDHVMDGGAILSLPQGFPKNLEYKKFYKELKAQYKNINQVDLEETYLNYLKEPSYKASYADENKEAYAPQKHSHDSYESYDPPPRQKSTPPRHTLVITFNPSHNLKKSVDLASQAKTPLSMDTVMNVLNLMIDELNIILSPHDYSVGIEDGIDGLNKNVGIEFYHDEEILGMCMCDSDLRTECVPAGDEYFDTNENGDIVTGTFTLSFNYITEVVNKLHMSLWQ